MILSQKGQSVVEMALVLPFLLLIIIGMFDVGRILYTKMHLEIATQETVRLGGLGKSDEEMKQFALGYIKVANPSSLIVTISPSENNRSSGEYVQVTLEYPIEFITPLLSNFLPSPITLISDSTIRVE